MRYRGTLAYDGTNFQGFQRQKDGVPTVQSAVEVAIAHFNRGVRVPVIPAGRTDTGVHATGQVIAFDLDWKHDARALLRAINSKLPLSIALHDLSEADPDFHPRFDAQRRQYRYTIVVSPVRQPLIRNRAWVVWYDLDLAALEAAAAEIIGQRDFAALGTPPQGNNTVRSVFVSEWAASEREEGAQLVYTIEANAFLYRMVRRTVGMLIDVGRGALTVDDLRVVLETAQIATGVTVAPPQGLVLTQVTYRS